MVKDLTVGKPGRLLLGFSIPLLLGNLFQQMYSMVDTIIVGQFVGVDALAAVGTTGPITFLILGFVMGLTGGFSVVAAQRFGAKDEDGLRHVVAMSAILCVVLTVVLTALSILFAMPLLQLMNTAPNIIGLSYEYIVIIFGGMFATVLYNMLSGIIRALGDSKTPLYFLILSSILNVVLDLVFIINFHMGAAGAAWATILSQLVSGILCLVYMVKRFPILRFQKKDWSFRIGTCLLLMKIGSPMAFQFSITAIGCIAMQGAINSFGSDTTAAFTAANKVESLSTQHMTALGTAISTYAGQNLGAGKMDRIREGLRKCMQIGIVMTIIGVLIILLFWRPLVGMFVSGESSQVERVFADAQTYLFTIIIFYLPLLCVNVYRNVLQGMGEALVPLIGGVMELSMRVLVAVFAVNLGFQGVCLASPMAWVGAAAVLVPVYYVHIRRLCRMQKMYEGTEFAKGEKDSVSLGEEQISAKSGGTIANNAVQMQEDLV
jgi:putative MATE family efflux protein